VVMADRRAAAVAEHPCERCNESFGLQSHGNGRGIDDLHPGTVAR
jgi:hypothetical protein